MSKDQEQLTREALEYMRDRYKDELSSLMSGHGTKMLRLREGMEEAKPKVEKATTEAEMKTVVADINKAPKGEDMLCQRECDRKEEKELVPMTVEWAGGGVLSYTPPWWGMELCRRKIQGKIRRRRKRFLICRIGWRQWRRPWRRRLPRPRRGIALTTKFSKGGWWPSVG